MKQNNYAVPMVPTAHICVNKSRIKLYNQGVDMPTYYLQSGTSFQFELFNPTINVLLAKIILNGKAISQGGLVINPGQRVFLDRYLDVAQKFLFDTYEVSNTAEVKHAIQNNGDIKIQFFKERPEYFPPVTIRPQYYTYRGCFTNTGGYNNGGNGIVNLGSGYNHNQYFVGSTCDLNKSNATFTSNSGPVVTSSVSSYSVSTDSLKLGSTLIQESQNEMPSLRRKKSLETGRVEKGSHSNQEFNYVNKSFEYYAFHTIEYKLLPISQKINTANDLNVKRYCTSCGSKLGKTDKFCSKCGKKA